MPEISEEMHYLYLIVRLVYGVLESDIRIVLSS